MVVPVIPPAPSAETQQLARDLAETVRRHMAGRPDTTALDVAHALDLAKQEVGPPLAEGSRKWLLMSVAVGLLVGVGVLFYSAPGLEPTVAGLAVFAVLLFLLAAFLPRSR